MMRSVALPLIVVLVAGALAFAAEAPTSAPPQMPERWLPLDENGWSVYHPAPDSQIIYVSSSEGDDATAAVYGPGDASLGNDPTRPTGPIKPFRTIPAALNRARDKMPDWVLLKRGDRWRDVWIRARNGRSAQEPFVIGAYGDAPERPSIEGRNPRLDVGGPSAGVSHVVVSSIDLYCSFLDPASPDYGVDEQTEDPEKNQIWSDLRILAGHGAPMVNVLVEDCRLRFCMLHVTYGGGRDGVMKDVVFRRNLVLDQYRVRGRISGMWGARATVLLEECVFDHNGWRLQNVEENKGGPGLANMMSHNTYCTAMVNTIFRDNMFLRAASIGNKWTANEGRASSRHIVVDNNLYVDGEIGISIGGNEPGPLRWKDIRVTNNVMLDIGKSRPTGRNLAWYLHTMDWDGGLIAGNLFLRQRHPQVSNAYAIHLESSRGKEAPEAVAVGCRNVTIRDNIVHGIESRRPLVVLRGSAPFENILLFNNQLQLPGIDQLLVHIDNPAGRVFRGNTYFSAAPADARFAMGSRNDPEMLSLDAWIERTGESGARFEKVSYPDSDRCIESYMRMLGRTPTTEAFIAEVRAQSKTNWRPELTASAVNDWIRAGFGARKVLDGE